MPARRTIQKISDRLLTLLFVAFLTIPLVGTYYAWDLYGIQENRRPAPFPDLATTSLDELPDEFGAYFKDHFGFRNYLIRRWSRLMRKIDKRLLQRVVEGPDRWLFYNRPEVIHDLLGFAATTEEDLEALRKSIEGRRSWLAERGIDYVFGVAPNKSSVYPEKLPAEIRAELRPTRLDKFIAHMAANSQVPVLDLRPALLEKKSWQTLHLSNDTHWNGYGAFIGYRAAYARLQDWRPELGDPLEFSDCSMTSAPFYGDLARMDDLPRSEYTIIRERIQAPVPEGMTTSEFEDPVFLVDGVRPPDYKTNPIYNNPGGNGKAVIFADSMFNKCVPLVAWHFAETTNILGGLTPEVLAAVVQKQEPDIVIEIIGERLLYIRPEQGEAWQEARSRSQFGKDSGKE
ncbi:MAG: alginate O-acetyltransferase AlgX-related protein [Planctomycetota bacterium]|jgi:hypothetical protein